LSRIIACIETVLNKNYDAIKIAANISANTHEADTNLRYRENNHDSSSNISEDSTSIDSDNTKQASSDDDTEQKPIPFLTINHLVRKRKGQFKSW
jgi:hypothetical protein